MPRCVHPLKVLQYCCRAHSDHNAPELSVKHHVDVAGHLANVFFFFCGNQIIQNGADCTQPFNYQATHCGLECTNLRLHQSLIEYYTAQAWICLVLRIA